MTLPTRIVVIGGSAAGMGAAGAAKQYDPQAQVTQWLGLGDGLSSHGTLVDAMEGKASLASIIQSTRFENLSFVASSQGLEDLGRQITDVEGYPPALAVLYTFVGAAVEGLPPR